MTLESVMIVRDFGIQLSKKYICGFEEIKVTFIATSEIHLNTFVAMRTRGNI